ncbi:penicillin-binding protein 2 [Alkalimonas delamerensis]|uniref:Peptidoglycan D,D-transpeptidase MrdA n=1 Tax=Alkalimonas delamerensis TaxID=265981 RepID=A0ABT9GS83_9GAMM|nr:penicillin-binding protein 2 [Alkalimonas delamerensis]MDP4529838.1 penicillin-binding protein 2 [Alkalimonas delamerensis]
MRRQREAIQDYAAEAQLFKRRALVAFSLVVLAFLLIFFNMYHLQVRSYYEYQTRSEGNRIKVVPVAPNRGLIYDRNGILLAENTPVHSLEIIPEQVRNLEETLTALAELIEISPEQKQSFLQDVRRQRRFNSIALKEQLTEQEVAILAVNQHRFPGVTLEARLSRTYPFGDLFTHAIGYIGRINSNDLQRLREQELAANYAASRNIGKIGLERYYEQLLHGTVGYQEVEVNNRGRVIRTLRSEPAISGKDLILSLDVGLQLTAQQALEGLRGAVVALDPRSGAVLALYSNPGYDPNLFVHGISSRDYNALLNSRDRPLINRVTQGIYAPASTIKPHLALAGLDRGFITPSHRIWDPGYYQLPNYSRRFRNWRRHGQGWVNVYGALIQSNDTYFYDMAVRMGIDTINDAMTAFGFGQRTGIDIHEESAAIMPSRGWKQARFNEPWFVGDTVSLGIGQSYWTATPLQLATTTAVLVNRGDAIVPQLLQASRLGEQLNPVEHQRHQAVTVQDANHWQVILDAMEQTISTPEGTAFRAFRNAAYTSGGKTGTAQVVSIAQDAEYDADALYERHRDNALYVGYAPAQDPTIVVAVVVENTGGGGSTAAPIARQLFDYYFSAGVNQ